MMRESVPAHHRIVAELDTESAQIEAVRGLIPRFEAKIQRVMDRVWGTDSNGQGVAAGRVPVLSTEGEPECQS